MFVSFLILVIVAILRVSVVELATKWEFFITLIPYVDIALWVALALFVVFVVIDIIKAFKK
ncbi:MAG: hypothetical protein IJW26_04295 [Clostridia bacterium]|nr:hypothetical protein [Clostridia bacterium]